jgi:hypothetical protein
VAANWPLIERVAEELFQRRKMTGAELRQILQKTSSIEQQSPP